MLDIHTHIQHETDRKFKIKFRINFKLIDRVITICKVRHYMISRAELFKFCNLHFIC